MHLITHVKAVRAFRDSIKLPGASARLCAYHLAAMEIDWKPVDRWWRLFHRHFFSWVRHFGVLRYRRRHQRGARCLAAHR